MRWLIVSIAVLVSACGAKRGGPSEAGAAPPKVVATPPDAPRPAPPPPHASACERACGRYRTCVAPVVWTQREHETCYDDCLRYLSIEEATLYADCMDRLTCYDVDRSTSMGAGPAGNCYMRSLRR